jgi:LPXTG-motif cell wall-anchored protein
MRAALVVVSVLVLLVGGVFAGQGLGFIPGSFMTGDMKWFWIGAVMVVIGLAIGAGGLLSGRRRQSRV